MIIIWQVCIKAQFNKWHVLNLIRLKNVTGLIGKSFVVEACQGKGIYIVYDRRILPPTGFYYKHGQDA